MANPQESVSHAAVAGDIGELEAPGGATPQRSAAPADAAPWREEVSRLEDLLENERAKSKLLARKLTIAESGPDKTNRQEMNFWRKRAEDFEAEKREFARRIAELRLQIDAQPPAPDPTADSTGGKDEVRKAEADLIRALEAARERIAGLEAELKDEKEFAASLNQVANERYEALTKSEEKAEESEERLAEAKWQLSKAQHFARLLKRRNGLIENLLATIRARNKANVALKAGLDGLRTYKAKAEANQSDLLARIDKLSSEVREREESVALWKRKYDFLTTEAPSAYQDDRRGSSTEPPPAATSAPPEQPAASPDSLTPTVAVEALAAADGPAPPEPATAIEIPAPAMATATPQPPAASALPAPAAADDRAESAPEARPVEAVTAPPEPTVRIKPVFPPASTSDEASNGEPPSAFAQPRE